MRPTSQTLARSEPHDLFPRTMPVPERVTAAPACVMDGIDEREFEEELARQMRDDDALAGDRDGGCWDMPSDTDPLAAARGLALGLVLGVALIAIGVLLAWAISSTMEREARETLRQQETLLGSSFRSIADAREDRS